MFGICCFLTNFTRLLFSWLRAVLGVAKHRIVRTHQIVLGGQRRQQLQYPMHVQSINSIALGCRKANRLQHHKLLNRIWIPHTNSITLGRAGYWEERETGTSEWIKLQVFVQDSLLSSKYTIHTPYLDWSVHCWRLIGLLPIIYAPPIWVGVFIPED